MYSQLCWRFIGPSGNRVSAVAGVPDDRFVYYAGGASGGVFKTIDAGLNWTPIFDDQPVASIGSLAVAPSDPSIVWAGTGESCIRSHISVGEGIFKSVDAGRTWTRMGLELTGRIGRVVVHPTNPEVVLACALGHAYGPQPERGVFRTTDGGASWEHVLFVDEQTGYSALAMDPANPRKLFAGMWQIDIKTWGRESGGPGSGLFVSQDGGTTWQRLQGRGLPTRPTCKHAVAIARSNPDRVYALIETGDGVPLRGEETARGQVWRSEDSGETWRVVSYDRNAMGRSHYFGHMFVAPDNENESYYLNGQYSISRDGGLTLAPQPRAETAPGGDHHDMWIDPGNANRMIVGHDQGLSISINRGRSWFRLRLPNAQMYHVTVDNAIPYNVYGNKQDGQSYRGPSRSRLGPQGVVNDRFGDVIPRSAWEGVGGGESGWATPDPVDPNIVWSTASGSGTVGGIVTRYEESRRQMRNVEVWPDRAKGAAADLKYRFIWDAPFLISPHDRHTVYTASQHVHRTMQRRAELAGHQPRPHAQRQEPAAALGRPDARQPRRGVCRDGVCDRRVAAGARADLGRHQRRAGAAHPRRRGALDQRHREPPESAGMGDGQQHRAVALRRRRRRIVTVDFHQVNNRDPFVYKTADYGATWRAITTGIPPSMLSYVHWLEEDPVRQGLLYLGTENAIYVSFDDGAHWQPLQTNLPHAPVYGIVVQEHFNDLVIGTYGRGFWILDDITPLQQLTPEVLASAAHLFPPRAAYRFREITTPSAPWDDTVFGEDAPYGASINYYLQAASADAVTVTILDAQGAVVRTLTGPQASGLNRLYWDLRYEATTEIRLRTSPLYAPHIQVGPEGWRPLPGRAGGAGPRPDGHPGPAGNLYGSAQRRRRSSSARRSRSARIRTRPAPRRTFRPR